MTSSIQRYYLGCPVWGCRDWVGEIFSTDARPKDYLHQYSRIFNTVEANSTFYGLPLPETVLRWKQTIPPDFRFSFKFPRRISHDYQLDNVDDMLREFLNLMEPLFPETGVFFLQLPPSFNHHKLHRLESFLKLLPGDLCYAVEVRHADFFDAGPFEEQFTEILMKYKVNRALFDTETLHGLASQAPDILEAQRKKPKMPARLSMTANNPFLRFVGDNQEERNLERLGEIAATTANWIRDGLRPFIFIHAPNEFFAPRLCRRFHQLLQDELADIDIGTLAEKFEPPEPPPPRQLQLF